MAAQRNSDTGRAPFGDFGRKCRHAALLAAALWALPRLWPYIYCGSACNAATQGNKPYTTDSVVRSVGRQWLVFICQASGQRWDVHMYELCVTSNPHTHTYGRAEKIYELSGMRRTTLGLRIWRALHLRRGSLSGKVMRSKWQTWLCKEEEESSVAMMTLSMMKWKPVPQNQQTNECTKYTAACAVVVDAETEQSRMRAGQTTDGRTNARWRGAGALGIAGTHPHK